MILKRRILRVKFWRGPTRRHNNKKALIFILHSVTPSSRAPQLVKIQPKHSEISSNHSSRRFYGIKMHHLPLSAKKILQWFIIVNTWTHLSWWADSIATPTLSQITRTHQAKVLNTQINWDSLRLSSQMWSRVTQVFQRWRQVIRGSNKLAKILAQIRLLYVH